MSGSTGREVQDVFARLRAMTEARIGLGRAGQGLPTAPMLAFQLAHARARDAVHAALDIDALRARIAHPSLALDSAASDRQAYLQNPDLGRQLKDGENGPEAWPCDLAIVIGDGLSATAVEANAPALVEALLARLADWNIGPVVFVRQARVAVGDPIGARMGARCVLMLLGERPGLSAADSLGAYITWAPAVGRRDSERNCVSNIRTPGGLGAQAAADKIAWLLREAKRLGLTGIALKDRSGPDRLPPPEPDKIEDAGANDIKGNAT